METTPKEKKKGAIREYVEAILVAVLIAGVLRLFLIEPFKIPTGSMRPTIELGDHIFVNKILYGIRLPLLNKQVIHFSKPKRGDIIVFLYPADPKKHYIKRLIGLPGDKIEIKQDVLFINDVPVERKELKTENSPVPFSDELLYEETLGNATYYTFYRPGESRFNDYGPIVIPEKHYFAMGDNRDNSNDSREWGFVPIDNVKGKGWFIWLSLNKEDRLPIVPLPKVRWKRIGKRLK